MNKSLTSSSSKKEVEEREGTKGRILKEYPNRPKDTIEFVLSLPVERKIPKVSKLETILDYYN